MAGSCWQQLQVDLVASPPVVLVSSGSSDGALTVWSEWLELVALHSAFFSAVSGAGAQSLQDLVP